MHASTREAFDPSSLSSARPLSLPFSTLQVVEFDSPEVLQRQPGSMFAALLAMARSQSKGDSGTEGRARHRPGEACIL